MKSVRSRGTTTTKYLNIRRPQNIVVNILQTLLGNTTLLLAKDEFEYRLSETILKHDPAEGLEVEKDEVLHVPRF